MLQVPIDRQAGIRHPLPAHPPRCRSNRSSSSLTTESALDRGLTLGRASWTTPGAAKMTTARHSTRLATQPETPARMAETAIQNRKDQDQDPRNCREEAQHLT